MLSIHIKLCECDVRFCETHGKNRMSCAWCHSRSRFGFSVAGAMEMCQKAFARDMANGIIQKIREIQVSDRDSDKMTDVLFLSTVVDKRSETALWWKRQPYIASNERNEPRAEWTKTENPSAQWRCPINNDVVCVCVCEANAMSITQANVL